MKHIFALVSLLAIMLSTTSCTSFSAKSSLIGTWTGMVSKHGEQYPLSFTFKPDGSVNCNAKNESIHGYYKLNNQVKPLQLDLYDLVSPQRPDKKSGLLCIIEFIDKNKIKWTAVGSNDNCPRPKEFSPDRTFIFQRKN